MIAALMLAVAAGGCGAFRPFAQPNAPAAGQPPVVDNPLFVPVADREFLWNQLVDATDDYFKIQKEERIRQIGGILVEGRIDTRPSVGSTLLEPWRHDATPGYEKLHGTLQSIRRQAVMRVIPTQGGYLIDLAVYKQLEDLAQPEHSTVGGRTLRHDSSLVRNEEQFGRDLGPQSVGWIPLGRDVSLEQRMLADIYARVTNVGPRPSPLFGNLDVDLQGLR